MTSHCTASLICSPLIILTWSLQLVHFIGSCNVAENDLSAVKVSLLNHLTLSLFFLALASLFECNLSLI